MYRNVNILPWRQIHFNILLYHKREHTLFLYYNYILFKIIIKDSSSSFMSCPVSGIMFNYFVVENSIIFNYYFNPRSIPRLYMMLFNSTKSSSRCVEFVSCIFKLKLSYKYYIYIYIYIYIENGNYKLYIIFIFLFINSAI